MKSYPRSRRVSDQILREASILLDSVLENQSFGLVSVTEVSLSKDLRYAKIFVSSLSSEDTREDLLKFLKQSCKTFRTQLAGRITIKYMPEITFEYDASVERGMKIESILTEIQTRENKTDTSTTSDSAPR
jgi:ribosome-binding factor A